MPVKHIVLFSCNEGVPVQEIVAAFTKLATTEIDLIQHFEKGENNSPEGLSEGLTQVKKRRLRASPTATPTVRALPGRLSCLSVLHSKSCLYGDFVWVHVRRALNDPFRRFSARAVVHPKHTAFVEQWVTKKVEASELQYLKDVCVFDYEL